MNDARFADADPAPLALVAQDVEDLTVISALVQDAVLPVTEITYDMRHRQLALLLNRFRWEDAEAARREADTWVSASRSSLTGPVEVAEDNGFAAGARLTPEFPLRHAPVRARAWGLTDATFVAEEDPETNFRLFRPAESAVGAEKAGASGVLARVRPNEDVCEAVEALCARHGLASATVRGIGSLVGAEFMDGRTVRSYASEVLITRGRVEPAEGSGPSATLDIVMVDMDGIIHEGRLVRGRNSVCITFEIYLE